VSVAASALLSSVNTPILLPALGHSNDRDAGRLARDAEPLDGLTEALESLPARLRALTV
jgi:hypothetical protein